jgi:hypothetical protein
MVGIYCQDKKKQLTEPLRVGPYRANVRYITRGISDDTPRYGLIIQTDQDEFIVAGYGIEVGFSSTTPGPCYTDILDVDMGHFEKSRWVRELRLNGDETAANYRAKIPPNTRNSFLDPTKPRILKVRVYRHD